MTPLHHITNLYKAIALREQSRAHLIAWIDELDLSDYEKGKLAGWGHNYKRRMNQNISDSALVEAVNKLMEGHNAIKSKIPK